MVSLEADKDEGSSETVTQSDSLRGNMKLTHKCKEFVCTGVSSILVTVLLLGSYLLNITVVVVIIHNLLKGELACLVGSNLFYLVSLGFIILVILSVFLISKPKRFTPEILTF